RRRIRRRSGRLPTRFGSSSSTCSASTGRRPRPSSPGGSVNRAARRATTCGSSPGTTSSRRPRLAADEPPAWDAGSFFQTRAFRLTPGELAELRDGIAELLGRFRRAEAEDAPADARPVRLLAFGYPVPLEET